MSCTIHHAPRISLLLTGLVILSCQTVRAQSDCEPSPALRQAIARDPSVGAYNALGGSFAEQALANPSRQKPN